MACRRGLTIVESLVVLAIVAGLIAILAPAVLSMRERARETECKNHLNQLSLALCGYAEVHKALPRPPAPGSIGGWTVEILPFLEQTNLKDTIPAGAPLVNAPESLHRPPNVFLCPRRDVLDGEIGGVLPAHYVFVPAGRESFLLYDAPIDLSEPWLSGPWREHGVFARSTGPHHGGFHFARGFQQGIDFQEGGDEPSGVNPYPSRREFAMRFDR